MLKALSLVLTLFVTLIIGSMAIPVSASFNLLENPGFETGIFDPWQYDSITGMVWISSPGHTGNYEASLNAEGAAWLFQVIDTPRCAEYLEFWYKGPDHSDVYVTYSDGTTLHRELAWAYTWILVHMDLDTQKTVKRVEVLISSYTTPTLEVDDFYLRPCSAPVGGELMSDSLPISVAPYVLLAGATGTAIIIHKKRRP